jgi:hypothetical protein
MQPERFIAKAQEQAVERDPDGLGIKLRAVVSALQALLPMRRGGALANGIPPRRKPLSVLPGALSLAEANDDEDVTRRCTSSGSGKAGWEIRHGLAPTGRPTISPETIC